MKRSQPSPEYYILSEFVMVQQIEVQRGHKNKKRDESPKGKKGSGGYRKGIVPSLRVRIRADAGQVNDSSTKRNVDLQTT